MRRKIAVFASGWGYEFFREIVYGIHETAGKEDMDTFVFTNFSILRGDAVINEGEFNMFTLPDLEEFDGIVLLANSFNLSREVEYFTEKLRHSNLPVVSIEYDFEHGCSIASDNYTGMYDLAQHVIEEHGAKNIVFIGGPQEHPESAERLKALQDVAGKNGFQVPEKNIKYGDWARKSALRLTSEWVKENGGIPEAFICANDVMAMAVCEQLDDFGYKVPRDVIVTGYDCLRLAQQHHPSIASVSHDWNRMGETAVQMLTHMMEGEAQESVILPTGFVPGRSCGCKVESGNNRMYLNRKSNGKEIDGLDADSHFRHIYLAVRKAESAQDLSVNLSELLVTEHLMEGPDFMLCLDPEFFHIEEGDLNLCRRGYSEKVEVVGAIMDGKELAHTAMSTKDAMYYFAREKETPGVYIFVPIYSEEHTYGFAVLTGNLRIACANQIYIWTRHISEYLEQVRRNITIADLTRKLTQLSVTDVLTGVYNRAGCEEIAFPLLKDWRDRGGTGVVMLVDVDKMKTINDRNGHANGDLALRTVAAVLKAELPEGWIISRFGGDEFFVGGRLTGTEIDLPGLCNRLEYSLAQEVKKRGIEFRLTVSIGSTRVEPGDTIEIEKYLQLADEDMYEVKDAHHKDAEKEGM